MTCYKPITMSIIFYSLLGLLQLANGYEMSNHINSLNTTWTATDKHLVDFRSRLGSILSHQIGYFELSSFRYLDTDELPEEFDVATAFPACSELVSHARDQSNCGSCWAFGATEAFNDRYCISTGDNTKVFSPTDTLACCSGITCGFSKGCEGGQPSAAWRWFVTHGVVEGGDYGDEETCKPYTFPSCSHHTDSVDLQSCESLPTYDTPTCNSECEYGDVKYDNDKFFAKDSYKLETVSDIQRDLMKYGTVTTAFSVYEDFETYSSGIYQHQTGKYLGGHAVKMIGWGVDNGVKYWTCVNSWNDEWGENGMFRILRGSDESGIESNVVAGTV